MSFFFRVIFVIGALAIVAMFLLSPEFRYKAFLIGTWVVVGLAVVVDGFAWFKPKNLVYGETGHRAETKFSFGTDQREISQAEVTMLEGSPNPKVITGGGSSS